MAKMNGFTLVELAIALMIIGLLIGGVLKGKELIENARNAQWVRQLNGYEVAVKTFKLTYDAIPGDMRNATTRLTGCTSAPCANGNNDKCVCNIGGYSVGAPILYYPTEKLAEPEPRNFWIHLNKANLIGGIDSAYNSSWSGEAGVEIPNGPTSSSLIGVSNYHSAALHWGSTSDFINGNYYVVRTLAFNGYVMRPETAFYIDQKLDDGKAFTGSVRPLAESSTNTPSADCVDSNEYKLTSQQISCNLMVLIK